MNKPHKHAALIKAWADGAEIEFYNKDSIHAVDRIWISARHPSWDVNLEYRIKPAREFPETKMSPTDLWKVYDSVHTTRGDAILAVANAAIKQYILDTEK